MQMEDFTNLEKIREQGFFKQRIVEKGMEFFFSEEWEFFQTQSKMVEGVGRFGFYKTH